MLRILILLVSLCLSLNGQAGLFDKKPTFLTSQQAFQFDTKQTGNQLALNWQIVDGYYLYQKEVQITPTQAELGEWQFPPAERHQDEFFGDVEIFRNELALQIPLKSAQNGSVEIHYQGCTKGFCYPPETVNIPLQNVPLQNVEAQAVNSAPNVANQDFANATENSTTSRPTAISQQDQLASQLSENRLSIIWFFVLGLGLAFTPCVLPMLPLLSAIVIGNQ